MGPEAAVRQASGAVSPCDVHILLVDDERLSRVVVGNLLRKCHYQVTVAESGSEALQILQKTEPGTFHLILTDVMMPEVDGLELLRFVRSSPLLANLPVVMMSASEHQETVYECIRGGAEEYLVKPVTRKEVQNIWMHVIKRNGSLAQLNTRLELEAVDTEHHEAGPPAAAPSSAPQQQQPHPQLQPPQQPAALLPPHVSIAAPAAAGFSGQLPAVPGAAGVLRHVAGVAVMQNDASLDDLQIDVTPSDVQPSGQHSQAFGSVFRSDPRGSSQAAHRNGIDLPPFDAAAVALRISSGSLASTSHMLPPPRRPAATGELRVQQQQKAAPWKATAVATAAASTVAGGGRASSKLSKVNLRKWLCRSGRVVQPRESFWIFCEVLLLLERLRTESSANNGSAVATAGAAAVLPRRLRPSFMTLHSTGKVTYVPMAQETSTPHVGLAAVTSQATGGHSILLRMEGGREATAGPEARPGRQLSDVGGTSQATEAALLAGTSSAQQSGVPTCLVSEEELVYRSPEEAVGSPDTSQSDMFALGILFFDLFYASPEGQRYEVLREANRRVLPAAFVAQQQREAAFVLALLHPEPESRPTLHELLGSDMFRHTADGLRRRHAAIEGEAATIEAAAMFDFLTMMKQRRLEDVRRVKRHLDTLCSDIQQVEHFMGAPAGLGALYCTPPGSTQSPDPAIYAVKKQRGSVDDAREHLLLMSASSAAAGEATSLATPASTASARVVCGMTPLPVASRQLLAAAANGAGEADLEMATGALSPPLPSSHQQPEAHATSHQQQQVVSCTVLQQQQQVLSHPMSQQQQQQCWLAHPDAAKAVSCARKKWLCVKGLQQQLQSVFLHRREAAVARAPPHQNDHDSKRDEMQQKLNLTAAAPSHLKTPPPCRPGFGGQLENSHQASRQATLAQHSAALPPQALAAAPQPRASTSRASPLAQHTAAGHVWPAAHSHPNTMQVATVNGATPSVMGGTAVLPEHLSSFSSDLSGFTRFQRLKVLAALRYGEALSTSNMICSAAFDRDDEFFATAGVSKRIKVFEYKRVVDGADMDQHYPVLEAASRSRLSCICWSSYIKHHLVSSDYEGMVQLWDANNGVELMQFEEHTKRVWSVDFSRTDPTRLVSGSDDGMVKVWSINQEHSTMTINSKANVCSVQFSPDASHLVAFGSANYRIYLYDLRHAAAPLAMVAGHNRAVSYVRYLSGSQLVSASTDNTLKLWDMRRLLSQEGAALGSGDSAVAPAAYVPSSSSNGVGGTTSAQVDLAVTYGGHCNKRNFVGLSVTAAGYIACGSEDNSVCCYYKALPMPMATCSLSAKSSINASGVATGGDAHKAEGGEGSGSQASEGPMGQFVSSVCWNHRGDVLLAANSVGLVKILAPVSDVC